MTFPSAVRFPVWLLLLSMLSVSCQPSPTAVEIDFDASYAGEPISCVPNASGRAISDLRFYVHDVSVTTNRGRSLPFTLVADDRWQSSTVALIDLENGEGYCRNGTALKNPSLRGQVALQPEESVIGIDFSIGVPENLNHANPMLADVPLAYSVMHWHWRSGYKFLRAGSVENDVARWFHLGSAQCAGTIGAIQGCVQSNRPRVIFDDFDPSADRLVVDLALLLAARPNDIAAKQSCESGVDEASCEWMFSALGLEFGSGKSTVSPPAIFVVKP